MSVEKAFEVPSIVINDLGGILSGTADPSSPGLNAPIGSIYMRDNGGVGEHWKKTGAADTSWNLQEDSGGAGGGFQGFGLWRYRTDITNNPSAGRLQFNNVTVDSATELYVNVTNDGGTDMTVFLTLLIEDDLIFIQNQSDSSQFVVVRIGGTPVLASGVFTFPIGSVESQGAAMANNQSVALLGSHSGGGGGSTVELDFAIVERLAAFSIPVFPLTLVPMDNVDQETNTAVIEADTGNNNRLILHEIGTYLVGYSASIDKPDPASNAEVVSQLQLNGVVITGTHNETSVFQDTSIVGDLHEDTMHGVSVIRTTSVDQFIELFVAHLESGGTPNPLLESGPTGEATSMWAIRLKGTKGTDGTDGTDGAQGVPGSGTTLNIQDEGVALPNSPHDAVNFIGAGVVASDAGGGVADVTIPGGGVSTFQATALGSTTTTSGTDVLVPGMSLIPGPGDFVVMFNTSWENSSADDMFVSIYVNGVQVAASERINEMESSIVDAELTAATHAFVQGVLAGEVIDIRFRNTGGTLTMLNRTLILLKVA